MKILHTADWHLGKVIYGRSLIEDQKHFIAEVFLPFLEQQRPDLIIMAGDIFDRQIAPVEAISMFDELITTIIDEYKIPLAIISGNHDSAERMCVGTRLLRNSLVYISTRIEDVNVPITFENDGEKVNIYLLPYFEPAQARECLKNEKIRGFGEAYTQILSNIGDKIDKTATNIMVAHCFVTGCSVSDSENAIYIGGSGEISASVFENFDYVALGHLHAPQKAGENGRYSGSPLAYSFDELKNKKSLTMLEITNKKVKYTEYPIVPLREMKVLKGNFDQIVEQAKNNPSDDYICVKLTDKDPIYMPMEQLRVYYPNILHLESNMLSAGVNKGLGFAVDKLKSGADDEKIFENFMKDIYDIAVDEEDIKVFNDAKNQVLREDV